MAAKEIDEEEDIPEVASHRIDDVTSADEVNKNTSWSEADVLLHID